MLYILLQALWRALTLLASLVVLFMLLTVILSDKQHPVGESGAAGWVGREGQPHRAPQGVFRVQYPVDKKFNPFPGCAAEQRGRGSGSEHSLPHSRAMPAGLLGLGLAPDTSCTLGFGSSWPLPSPPCLGLWRDPQSSSMFQAQLLPWKAHGNISLELPCPFPSCEWRQWRSRC